METMLMDAWSPIFLSDDTSSFDWATCAVNSHIWRTITDMYDASRIIACIESGENKLYVALGGPIIDTLDTRTDKLFVPPWILGSLNLEGCGEPIQVSWMSQEAFPSATRIVLRPHDSAFHTVDAKEELECALTRLGVLYQGKTIRIPISALDGYEIDFDIMITEPAEVVLAEGDEVVMEFEQALDAPLPLQPQLQLPLELPMLVPIKETDSGQTLGGAPTRRMADGRPWNPYR
jgi:hypothetical protein